ncbi:hypothetical protein COCNU_scaffold014566G000020 [Cocos nucifera]|nr:hypothetical protein [Cocos nucifera]
MSASGAKGGKANPGPSPGTHPRYIPKRGDVLKRILRALFGLAPPPGRSAPRRLT